MDIKEELERRLTLLENASIRQEQEVDHLIAKYGEGVRPSWVSTDIGIALALSAKYKAQEQALRDQLDKL